jgi:membrane protein implicated in regulation of membrane protease activity
VLDLDSAALAWAALAIVSAFVEVLAPHFGIIFAAMGAAAAALAAMLSFGTVVQAVVFVVGTGLSMALLRQRFVKSMAARRMPSRAEAHVAREGVVTHDIDPLVGAGRVNVGGEDWAARAAVPIATGTRIRVVGSDGIVLEVTPT